MELNISLSPEVLFHLGSFPVTNSLLWEVFISVFLIAATLALRFSLKTIPGRAQAVFELLVEEGYNFVKTIIGSDKKAKMVFPLVMTLFIFIATANIFTFIPGQAALYMDTGEGMAPVFRAVMADYGMVFLMTMITVITVQIVAIAVHGPFGYIGKFINLKGIKGFFIGPDRFKPATLAQGLLDFILGLMDIIGEAAKIFSLSFRLFGNIFAGEVLGAVMLFLAPFIVPLPFMFLSVLTAIVQAFVFAVLTLVFITLASEIEEDELVEAASI